MGTLGTTHARTGLDAVDGVNSERRGQEPSGQNIVPSADQAQPVRSFRHHLSCLKPQQAAVTDQMRLGLAGAWIIP